MVTDERFQLDPETAAVIAEFREQIKAAQYAMQGVLIYFTRRHELPGNWQLAESGREIVRRGAAQAEAFSRADTGDGLERAPVYQDSIGRLDE